MTTTDYQPVEARDKRMVFSALSLVFVSILSACSDSGLAGAEQTASNNAAPVITVRPSQSAVQLADDSTVTVQGALALSQSESQENPETAEQPAAANPDNFNPLQPSGTIEESTGGNTSEPNTGSANPVTGSIYTESGSNNTADSLQSPDKSAENSDETRP